MAITPSGLATTLAKAAERRSAVTEVTHQNCVANGISFKVHDDAFGILEVTVTQYKEPIR